MATNTEAWHSTPQQCITIPSLVIQQAEWFRRYRLDKQLKFWTVTMNLTLNMSILYFQWTPWLMMLYQHTTFHSKRMISSEDTAETVISPQWDPTLKTAVHLFHLTLWLTMMLHNTQFGYKMLSSSEDILWTKLNTWTEGQTDRQMDMVIPIYHPNFVGVGVGGWGWVGASINTLVGMQCD